MIRRSLSILLAVLAVGLYASSVRADNPPAPGGGAGGHHGFHRATFQSADGGKIVVNTKKNGDQTLDLADKVKITIDGQPGKIEDLAKGDKIGYKLGTDGKVTDIHKGKRGSAPAPAPAPSPSPAPSPAPAPSPGK